MTDLTIRNLDESTTHRLPPAKAPSGLGKRLRDRFAGLAAEDFVVPERQAPRTAPQWDAAATVDRDQDGGSRTP